jgi:ferredoxin
MSRMHVTVDTGKCQSYQRCSVVAPAVFGLGNDGKVRLIDAGGADDAVVLKAAKSCPYRAITVVDEATNEQLWPKARAARPPENTPLEQPLGAERDGFA